MNTLEEDQKSSITSLFHGPLSTESKEYIFHVYEDRHVRQRVSDGYFSATDMCKSVNRLFADFNRSKNTKEYLKILQMNLSLPENDITQNVDLICPSMVYSSCRGLLGICPALWSCRDQWL